MSRVPKNILFDYLILGIIFVVLATIVVTILSLMFGVVSSFSMVSGQPVIGILLFFIFLLAIFMAIGWLVSYVGGRVGRAIVK